jgi:hypothetical protein
MVKGPISYTRLVGTIFLCVLGLWFALTGHAKFGLGGDPDSQYKNNHVIHVDARGADAVAIGCFFIALGVVNLALGIRDRRRIPVFWAGAGLMMATFLYAIVLMVLAVVHLFV